MCLVPAPLALPRVWALRYILVVGEGPDSSPLSPAGPPLLEAKLEVPAFRPGWVSRAPLIEAARASKCRIIAVTAPAGYGKSSLLAEWASLEDRPVAWVTLDRLDDDPAALLALLAAALLRVGPASEDIVADMAGLGLSVLGRATPRLAAAMRSSPTPFVLMLDDLHELQSPTCNDALGILIANVPDGSQFVAASRADQPHLPRLRVSGDAMEIVASDLALDAAGAQEIFAMARVEVTPEVAASITERTEGWPAGLYLAALIAKERVDMELSVAGDDRYLADYLYRESLAQLPEEWQRFMRRTAILDQLSGELCDALLGSSNGSDQLRRLEARSLFLIPLDRRRQWYRYHALFREFLLSELHRVEPGMVEKLHLRAADWYATYGHAYLAVEHLVETSEYERCVQLVTELILPTYNAGQMSTVQRWLSAIGDAHIREYPPLAVLATWVTALTGATGESLRWATIVDEASFDMVPMDGSASFESARAMLRAVLCRDGPESMMQDARFAVAQEREWSPWRDTALWLLGEAHLLAGEREDAAACFVESSEYAAQRDNTDSVVVCESQLALLAMDRGHWDQAPDRLHLALSTIEDHRMHDYVMSFYAFVGAARLALHGGDPKEAHRQLTRGMRARPASTYAIPFVAVRFRLQLAKTYLAMADVTTARYLLREIEDILVHRPALGALIDEVQQFRAFIADRAPSTIKGTSPLTAAELRVLPLLQTHLTFREIAGRLFVSRNTVSTQVNSIYRKLGVSSRSDAVTRAVALGLLGE